MTSWLISLVIYLCHRRLMMLGSHQMVQAWGDVYLSICKDYPLSTAVQRCLGCWPCKAGEHISVPYITSSVATWEVKYTAWMGLAWPQYFPMVIVFKGNSWIPEDNQASIFSLYFSDLIDFLAPSLLLFLVEYQEYWWVRQQVPLSTISSLILCLRASLFPSFPLYHKTTYVRSLSSITFHIYMDRSRLCQCSSRPGPLFSLIKFHSIVSWWIELRRRLCPVWLDLFFSPSGQD